MVKSKRSFLVVIIFMGFLLLLPGTGTFAYFSDVETGEGTISLGTWESSSESIETNIEIRNKKIFMNLSNNNDNTIVINKLKVRKHISTDLSLKKIKLGSETRKDLGENFRIFEDLNIQILPNKNLKLRCKFDSKIEGRGNSTKNNSEVQKTGSLTFRKTKNKDSNQENTQDPNIDLEITLVLDDGSSKVIDVGSIIEEADEP